MTCLLIVLLVLLAAMICAGVWKHMGRERPPISRHFGWAGKPMRVVDLEPTEYSTFWEGK